MSTGASPTVDTASGRAPPGPRPAGGSDNTCRALVLSPRAQQHSSAQGPWADGGAGAARMAAFGMGGEGAAPGVTSITFLGEAARRLVDSAAVSAAGSGAGGGGAWAGLPGRPQSPGPLASGPGGGGMTGSIACMEGAEHKQGLPGAAMSSTLSAHGSTPGGTPVPPPAAAHLLLPSPGWDPSGLLTPEGTGQSLGPEGSAALMDR